MKVAVLKGGRSLERQVSLRSGARVEDALRAARPRGRADRRRPGPRRPAAASCARTSRSSRCTAAAARTARCRSCSSCSASRTPAPARRPASAAWTRSSPSTSCATPGCRRPTSTRSARPRSRSSAPRRRCRRSRSGSTSRSSSSPPPRARRSGIKFARTAADVPAAIVAAFSYDTKVLLERYVAGRDLAVSVLDGPDGPEALPVVEAIPHEEDFYDFEARYEIGRTAFICPARLGRTTTARAQELALAAYRDARLLRLRARRPDARRRHRRADRARGQRDPGLTDTSLLPLAAEAAGIAFDDADRADRSSWPWRARRPDAAATARRPGSPRA